MAKPDPAPPPSIAALLSAQATATPSAAAIAAPNRVALDYGALWAHVQDTASALHALGIGRHDRVAIVIPNGPEMALAFLAVTCTATAAPLNPAYGESEFAFYFSDLRLRALLLPQGIESPARAVAAAQDIPVVELVPARDGAAGLFTLQPETSRAAAPPELAEPQDVALILHTSGTTSRPKGVPLTHANLCASARHIQHTLQLTSADRCLNVLPLFHIHGLVAALLASLSAGGSVCCTPGLDAAQFFSWLEESQATWYTAVPTLHQAILAQAPRHRQAIARAPLRFIRSSSAALPPRVMQQLESTFGAPVIEAYGMTEAAHQMTSNPLPPGQRKPGSVGPPAGPEVTIMDGEGNLLAPGETGEVVIRGPNVMGGYLNNPQANQQAFVKGCYGVPHQRGWFRSGDLGFLDADGYLFLSGRIKETINRGGEKVNPAEVDRVLLEHPLVAQAVTFPAPHPTLGEDVLAAVVPQEGAAVDEGELRAFAFSRLAGFKVPTQILIVAEIPKGPTGKLQRLGLAEQLADSIRPEFVAPRSLAEEALARLWVDVLEVQHVGVHDNFFALGGDSLQAARLVARVRASFEVELPLSSIFRTPTLAEQAATIEEMLLADVEALSDDEARALLD